MKFFRQVLDIIFALSHPNGACQWTKSKMKFQKGGLKYSFHDNVSNALSAAVKDSNESDTILVTGSTFRDFFF